MSHGGHCVNIASALALFFSIVTSPQNPSSKKNGFSPHFFHARHLLTSSAQVLDNLCTITICQDIAKREVPAPGHATARGHARTSPQLAQHQHDICTSTASPSKRAFHDGVRTCRVLGRLGQLGQLGSQTVVSFKRLFCARACVCSCVCACVCARVRACVGGGGGARAWVRVITIGLSSQQKNRQRGNYLTSPHNLLQLAYG
jgi:hypothetical protein